MIYKTIINLWVNNIKPFMLDVKRQGDVHLIHNGFNAKRKGGR